MLAVMGWPLYLEYLVVQFKTGKMVQQICLYLSWYVSLKNGAALLTTCSGFNQTSLAREGR